VLKNRSSNFDDTVVDKGRFRLVEFESIAAQFWKSFEEVGKEPDQGITIGASTGNLMIQIGERFIDVRQVSGNHAWRDTQTVSNLTIVKPLADQEGYLALAWRETHIEADKIAIAVHDRLPLQRYRILP